MPKTFYQALASFAQDGHAVSPLSASEQMFLEAREYPARYDISDKDGQREALEMAYEDVKLLRSCYGTDVIRVEDPTDEGGGDPDGRWRLLRDLGQAAGEMTPAPLEVESQRMWISRVGLGVSRRVVVSFDSRLSRRALFAELTRMWPRLRDDGRVRATRPLGERKLTLLRFVCIEASDKSWNERLDLWNSLYGEKWEYKESARMQSDFARAEESLTGLRHGLVWFYEPAVREVWGLSDEQIIESLAESDLSAAKSRALIKTLNARRPPLRITTEEEHQAAVEAVVEAKRRKRQ